MLTCVTTRMDSHSPYVPLFRESDPRKTRYALSLQVYPGSASSGRPSPATFFPFRAPIGCLSSTQDPFNPHASPRPAGGLAQIAVSTPLRINNPVPPCAERYRYGPRDLPTVVPG
jgi:hypothetical protein